jgi:zinc-ribbon domain
MPLITCPHCGLSKEVPAERLPPGPVRVTCPQCRTGFIFPDTEEAQPVGRHDDAGAEPIAESEESRTDGARGSVPPSEEMTRKQLQLRSIEELFAISWESYKQRLPTLIGLLLLAALPFLALAGALAVVKLVFGDLGLVIPLVAGIALTGIVAILLISCWSGAAFTYAVADERLTLREALEQSWPRLGSFVWISMLTGFIIQGGFWLFFVPGVIFTVWFFFSQFVFVTEGERGMNALLKSKEYIRGNFADVFVRLFILLLIWSVITAIPGLGVLLSLFFWPFAMIFACHIYRDLREIKGDVSISESGKWTWLGAGLLGYLLIPFVLFAMLGTTLLLTIIGPLRALLQAG